MFNSLAASDGLEELVFLRIKVRLGIKCTELSTGIMSSCLMAGASIYLDSFLRGMSFFAGAFASCFSTSQKSVKKEDLHMLLTNASQADVVRSFFG